MTVEPKVVSVPAAAVMLGIGRNHAYELCRTGVLPNVRLGRRIVIPTAAIDRLLAVAGTGPGTDPGTGNSRSEF